jgi:hypothetical protein
MKTLDPSFRGGVCSSLGEVLLLNKLHHKNFTLRVLPEFLYTPNCGILFQKNSPYVESFNELIRLFKSAGLIDFWVSKYLDNSYLKVKNSNKEPKVMNFEQLEGIFGLLMFGCLISIVCFVLELIYHKFSNSRKRLFLFTP